MTKLIAMLRIIKIIIIKAIYKTAFANLKDKIIKNKIIDIVVSNISNMLQNIFTNSSMQNEHKLFKLISTKFS